jgi:hypothetical protein
LILPITFQTLNEFIKFNLLLISLSFMPLVYSSILAPRYITFVITSLQ